jgi:hypothetical protein
VAAKRVRLTELSRRTNDLLQVWLEGIDRSTAYITLCLPGMRTDVSAALAVHRTDRMVRVAILHGLNVRIFRHKPDQPSLAY